MNQRDAWIAAGLALFGFGLGCLHLTLCNRNHIERLSQRRRIYP